LKINKSTPLQRGQQIHNPLDWQRIAHALITFEKSDRSLTFIQWAQRHQSFFQTNNNLSQHT